MATRYYLRIRANQASNVSTQSLSYSEIKQVAKGWYVVRLISGHSEQLAISSMYVQNTT